MKQNNKDMKELTIKQLPQGPQDAAGVSAWLDANAVEWTGMDAHNWATDYPYRPEVRFRIATTADNRIVVEYDVKEGCIRAQATEDNGRVWEDSCCELFIAPEDDGVYYNFECNCIGSLRLGGGRGRADRQPAPPEVLAKIGRWTTFKHRAIPLTDGEWHWRLVMVIPVEALFLHHVGELRGRRMRCNLYKCGDLLSRPHFMSWNPVGSEKPNFHLPDFFGTISF